MKVEKLMTTNVGTCHPDDRGVVAAKIMWERDCGAVPVVDESSHVLGMVTDRDLCIASYLEGKPLHDISVAQVMSRELWSCRPEEDVSLAENMMKEHQVRRLPVIDKQDRLVGMLALSDVALEAAKEARSRASKTEVSYADVARALADISVPHRAIQAPRAS